MAMQPVGGLPARQGCEHGSDIAPNTCHTEGLPCARALNPPMVGLTNSQLTVRAMRMLMHRDRPYTRF
mgnify:CR=1 FL=1